MGITRNYTIPEQAQQEFERHAAHIFEEINRSTKVPSKRSLRALNLIPKQDWIGQYYMCLVDRPGAIILSKGWSLNEESAKTIRELIGKGWYCMAALQAIEICNKLGIKPHSVCAMDPQRLLVPYLEHVPEGTWLFHDAMVDPAFWEADIKRVTFSSYSAHIHDNVIRRAGMWVIDLPNHTVSEIMQALVQHMGARRVYFAGIDYCIKKESLEKEASAYDWRTILLDNQEVYSNMHYCLGLQAFLRHIIVDHYSPEKFESMREDIEKQTENSSKETGHPKVAPWKWSNYHFYRKIAVKRLHRSASCLKKCPQPGNRKCGHCYGHMRTGLTTKNFKQEMIDDFNP